MRSSIAVAGKELSLSSWCIASSYIYHFSNVDDFSSEKNSGSTEHRNFLVPEEKFTVRMPMMGRELSTGTRSSCVSVFSRTTLRLG